MRRHLMTVAEFMAWFNKGSTASKRIRAYREEFVRINTGRNTISQWLKLYRMFSAGYWHGVETK